MNQIKERLEKYFDIIFIDEVQDFASHDFNFLMQILEANVNFFMVGDFYQHTYDSSQDGNVNINLYKDYTKYKKLFKQKNIKINTELLKKSRRCSKTVCEFIKNKIGIDIESEHEKETLVEEIVDEKAIINTIENDKIVKLFYNNHIKYNIKNTNNWGNSKGETYNDVCVILNPNTYKLYKKNRLIELPQQTKNKLYVACSRAKNNLNFIEEKKIAKYKK
jgi:DNA helicase-2/ATP-dependent DNA helicase PcrA